MADFVNNLPLHASDELRDLERDKIALQIGQQLAYLARGIEQKEVVPTMELGDTYEVVNLSEELINSHSTSEVSAEEFSHHLVPSGYFHHQLRLRDNEVPIGFARSRRATEEEVSEGAPAWIVVQVSPINFHNERLIPNGSEQDRVPLASAVDHAVHVINQRLIGNSDARLVEVMSRHTIGLYAEVLRPSYKDAIAFVCIPPWQPGRHASKESQKNLEDWTVNVLYSRTEFLKQLRALEPSEPLPLNDIKPEEK